MAIRVGAVLDVIVFCGALGQPEGGKMRRLLLAHGSLF